MARAKRRDAWDHTANVLALLINVNRDPKKSSAATAEKIHPFREEPILTFEEKRAALKESLEILRDRTFGARIHKIPCFTPINHQAPG